LGLIPAEVRNLYKAEKGKKPENLQEAEDLPQRIEGLEGWPVGGPDYQLKPTHSNAWRNASFANQGS